jgi:DNA-binding transcriptional ArsR family regulator
VTEEPAEFFEIEDTATFELLTDPTRVELLEHLFEPASVTEVAEAMGVPRTRLYHHVNLLEEAGMIRVVETRRRGAMTERRYQVAAKSFRPSPRYLAGVVPREAAAAALDSIFAVTRADLIKAVDEGMVSFEQSTGRRSMALRRSLIRLTPERLDQLVAELEELLGRYEGGEEGDPVGVTAVVYRSARPLP